MSQGMTWMSTWQHFLKVRLGPLAENWVKNNTRPKSQQKSCAYLCVKYQDPTLRYVGVIWFVFPILQLLLIRFQGVSPFIIHMSICECTIRGYYVEIFRATYTQIITHNYAWRLYLYARVTYWGLFIWKYEWGRGVIMITYWLMVLVHKVVTRKIVVLEERIIGRCHNDMIDVVASWRWFTWRCGVAKCASTWLGCSNWWRWKHWNAFLV